MKAALFATWPQRIARPPRRNKQVLLIPFDSGRTSPDFRCIAAPAHLTAPSLKKTPIAFFRGALNRNAGTWSLPTGSNEPVLRCPAHICHSGIRKSAWRYYSFSRESFNSGGLILVLRRSHPERIFFRRSLRALLRLKRVFGFDFCFPYAEGREKDIKPPDDNVSCADEEEENETDFA